MLNIEILYKMLPQIQFCKYYTLSCQRHLYQETMPKYCFKWVSSQQNIFINSQILFSKQCDHSRIFSSMLKCQQSPRFRSETLPFGYSPYHNFHHRHHHHQRLSLVSPFVCAVLPSVLLGRERRWAEANTAIQCNSQMQCYSVTCIYTV